MDYRSHSSRQLLGAVASVFPPSNALLNREWYLIDGKVIQTAPLNFLTIHIPSSIYSSAIQPIDFLMIRPVLESEPIQWLMTRDFSQIEMIECIDHRLFNLSCKFFVRIKSEDKLFYDLKWGQNENTCII